MQDLSSVGLMPEEWGGDTPMVKVTKLRPLMIINPPPQLQHTRTLKKEEETHTIFLSGMLKLLLNNLKQISALKGENVDDLLETVMLISEVTCTLIFRQRNFWLKLFKLSTDLNFDILYCILSWAFSIWNASIYEHTHGRSSIYFGILLFCSLTYGFSFSFCCELMSSNTTEGLYMYIFSINR